jgi:hypothetical protein
MATERTRSPSLVLDLRRAERRRLHDAAHAGQLDQPLSERVRGGRADRVDGEQAGVPGQDLREAGPQQVDAHVPPGLEHVPRAPAHVAHHRSWRSRPQARPASALGWPAGQSTHYK